MRRLSPCLLVLSSMLPFSSVATADEAEAIKKFVFEAQRAGFERGELKGYMKQWAKDARIVMGRGEKPGEFDRVIKRKAIEATRRILFTALPEGGYKTKYEDVRVKVDGDKAVLTTSFSVRSEGGYERVKEIYRLRRVGDGWKVYENRVWPLETKFGDKETRYNEETWKKLDAKVAEAKQGNDVGELVRACQVAWRQAEAHQASRKLTELPNASADDWVTRGWTALNAGDAEDAIKAFKLALKLNPDAHVPGIIDK